MISYPIRKPNMQKRKAAFINDFAFLLKITYFKYFTYFPIELLNKLALVILISPESTSHNTL